MEKTYRLWMVAIVRLRRSAMGKLLDEYDSAEAVYNLSEAEINAIGYLSDEEKYSLCQKEINMAKSYLTYIENNGTRFITPADYEYPSMLFDIADIPQGLFCKGKFTDLNSNIQIAMVGARKCTQYGYECAKKIAHDISRSGAIVVSGMATGIDSAAHEGALEANRPTIAVLGCGVNVVYPPSNHLLMKRIMETGMVMSEYPVNMEANRFTFPDRNRIIAGVSHGLAVIEATQRSGSLITAGCAKKQNKDLFAVPGNINSPSSSGTNNLIKEGARIVTCADDIISLYGDKLSTINQKLQYNSSNEYLSSDSDNNDIESAIIDTLTSEPIEIEKIADITGKNTAELSTILLMMELSGKVMSHPGGRYSRPI